MVLKVAPLVLRLDYGALGSYRTPTNRAHTVDLFFVVLSHPSLDTAGRFKIRPWWVPGLDGITILDCKPYFPGGFFEDGGEALPPFGFVLDFE